MYRGLLDRGRTPSCNLRSVNMHQLVTKDFKMSYLSFELKTLDICLVSLAFLKSGGGGHDA